MDFHVLTPAGAEHICSLIGGKVVIAPAKNAPQTPKPAESAGHEKRPEQ